MHSAKGKEVPSSATHLDVAKESQGVKLYQLAGFAMDRALKLVSVPHSLTLAVIKQPRPGFIQQFQSPCTACQGTGQIVDKSAVCKTCQLRSLVDEEKEFEIQIPKGVHDGTILQFDKESHQLVRP